MIVSRAQPAVIIVIRNKTTDIAFNRLSFASRPGSITILNVVIIIARIMKLLNSLLDKRDLNFFIK